ncbi:MAG: PAS domain S-box protein [Chloroflexi bacterium]|jgi:PAS domain S-box-containing protein|nr:PAS domain S-box protein [Chloroflexota bacterium]
MTNDLLGDRIRALHERIATLRERTEMPSLVGDRLSNRLPQVLQELIEVLGKLQTTGEELRQQNIELMATGQVVEAERRRYRELFELAPDGYLVTTPQGVIQEANRGVAELLGVGVSELTNTSLSDHVCPEDRPAFSAWLRQLLERETTGDELPELRLCLKGGSTKWVSLSVVAARDAEGQVVGIHWMVHDVSKRREAEHALQESEARYRSLFDNVPVGLYRSAPSGQVLDANPALVRLLGFPSREALLERGTWAGYVIPADRERWQALMARDGVVRDFETQWLRQDGEPIWVEESARSETDAEGHVLYYEGAVRDITERKKAEARLQETAGQLETANERLQVLGRVVLRAQESFQEEDICNLAVEALQQLGLHAFIIKRRGERLVVDHVSPDSSLRDLFSEMVGGELVGMSFPRSSPVLRPILAEERAVYLPDSTELLDWVLPQPLSPQERERLRASDLSRAILAPMVSRDKLIGLLCIWSSSLRESDVPDMMTFASQLAVAIDNARLYEAVTHQRERLRAMGRRLAEAQEIERRELARELHDRVGQSLSALSITLGVIGAQIAHAQAIGNEDSALIGLLDSSSERVKDALVLVEETTREIRNLMTDLRPVLLDDYGLVPTLRWYVTQLVARTGIDIQTQGDLSGRLQSTVETALFRIAQEALNNAIKHANATQIKVSLEETHNSVRLIVADNGVGFDPEGVVTEEHQGRGLTIMAERAEAVGGHLAVESRPDHGTRVLVEVSR